MKKILVLVLTIAMAFSVASCSQSAASTEVSTSETETEISGNIIAQYIGKGYQNDGISNEEYEKDGKTLPMKVMYFLSPDKKDYVKVTAKLTEEEGAAYNAIEFTSDFFEKCLEVLKSIPDDEIEVEDMSSLIPTEEEMNQYVGKTIGDLIADGYERWNDHTDESGDFIALIYANWDTGLELDIYIDEEYTKETKIYQLSDEEVAALTITKVGFYGRNIE